MAFPQPFTTVSPQVASYNYSELANGLGYEIFYAVGCKPGDPIYFLSSVAVDGGFDMGVTSTGINYDTSTFNNARTVGGKALISAEGANGNSSTFAATFYKVDSGGTATAISSTYTSEAVSADGQKVCMPIEITTTKIAYGEKLRLNITAGSGGQLLESSAYIRVDVPFKI